MSEAAIVPAGWYQDPHPTGGLRWFDGIRWTQHTQPPPQQALPPQWAPPQGMASAGTPLQHGTSSGWQDRAAWQSGYASAPAQRNLGLEFLVPINRNPLAIIAGYLGIFSIIVFPAPFAVIIGVLALRQLRHQPTVGGRGRAIFGIVVGSLVCLGVLIGLLDR